MRETKVRGGAIRVTGKLAPEVVERVVRASFPKFRHCYETELVSNPKLDGQITLKIAIKANGEVERASEEQSTLADARVVSCVVGVAGKIVFPTPEQGNVAVVFPILFSSSAVP